jgi:UDP-N-acetylmuramoylalanine--D-glutamate ligase
VTTLSAHDFAGRETLVVGAGRSGRAAGALLRRMDARVHVYDRDPAALRELGFDAETLSGDRLPSFDDFDWIVQSPGVPVPSHPRLLPEVDLAAALLRAPLVCITGSNGKSTTTTLIAEMLRVSGLRVALGGNLGTPLCALVDEAESADWVVAELSSFQLEHARRVHARVAVLLNLAPNHFDRHRDLTEYAAAKERLAELQRADDTLVVNLDDDWARGVAERSTASALGASLGRRPADAMLRDAHLEVVLDGATWLRTPLASLAPACRRYPLNALTAALAAATAGATAEAVERTLVGFDGLPHRAQRVAVLRGVTWVNDSKATSPAAAIGSVAAESAPVVWLLGGVNKGIDLRSLVPTARRARSAIAFGKAGDEIAEALHGATDVVRVPHLADAVREAAARAQPGDVVLLAPACASFDEFRNYEERGERFAALVRSLPC